MNLVVLLSPFQSRTEYAVRAAGGDVGKAAAWIAYMSAGAGGYHWSMGDGGQIRYIEVYC